MSDMKYLDNSSYKDFIASGMVVIDFYADWCGPCKVFAPVFEEAVADYDGRVKFAKVNVDENREIAIENKIMGIPTMIFFKDGQIADRVSGVLNKGALYSKIDSLL